MTSTPDVTGSIQIAAPASTIYEIITDLSSYSRITAETDRMRWSKGDHATPGAVFRGRNRNGWHRWTTTCTVTAAEPGREFAFEVSMLRIPISRWSYLIEQQGDHCTVTESSTNRMPEWFKPIGALGAGEPDRPGANRAHIDETLANLKAAAERASATGSEPDPSRSDSE